MTARRDTQRPPRFTSAFLRALLGRDGEFVLGDLEEGYGEVHAARGEAEANRWYRRQAVSTTCAWMRRGSPGIEQWLRDVRDGAKALLRAPGFSLATAITLGLGLGGAASVVALAESVLRPLPFPDAERLVAVWESHEGERRSVAPANYLDWRATSTSFDALAAHRTTSMSIRVDGLARRGRIAGVSGNFFDVLGVVPRLGRAFDGTLRTDFPERVVVLSHTAWVNSFAEDPGVLGRAFQIDDLTYEVIGVAPPDLEFPEPGLTAWVRSPTEAPEIRGFGADLPQLRDAWYFEVVGRLSDGVTVSAARDEMRAVALRLAALHPDSNTGATTLLIPLLEQTVAGFRATLVALMIAVALLLLAAGVNVTHLALGRGASRRADMAVRVALGAGRSTLVRQVLIEGWLLGLAGAGAGLGLARATLGVSVQVLGGSLPRAEEVALRLPAAFGVLALGLAIGTAVSLIAFMRTRPGKRPSLALAGRGWVGGAAGNSLVAAQVAAAVALLAGAGLLARSVQRLADVDLGIDVEDVVTLRVAIPDAGTHAYAERLQLYDDLTTTIAALPGIRAVGYGRSSPLTMGAQAGLVVLGRGDSDDRTDVGWHPVTPTYFEAMGIPLLMGRGFSPADRRDALDVGILNEAAARAAFPGADPLGRQVTIGLDGHDRPITIVAVVGDTRTRGPATEPGPVLFRPMAQTDGNSAVSMFFAARTPGAQPEDLAAVLQAIRTAAPGIPVYQGALGTDLARPFRSTQASLLLVLGVFALTALALGAVGVYGVAAYAVRRRRWEIGVRMALGADGSRVVREVVLTGTARAALGIPCGLLLTLALGRALQNLLFEVPSADPVTFTVVSVLVLSVTIASLVLPARTAAATDPAVATRE